MNKYQCFLLLEHWQIQTNTWDSFCISIFSRRFVTALGMQKVQKHCWYSENGKTASSVLLNAQLILLLCLLHHVTTYHTCKLNIQQYRQFYISKNCHHNQEDLCILYYVFVKHLQIIIIIHLIHADCTVRFIASNKK